MRIAIGVVVLLVALAGCVGNPAAGNDQQSTETPQGEPSVETPQGKVITFSDLKSVEQEAFLDGVESGLVTFGPTDDTYDADVSHVFKGVDYVKHNNTYYAIDVNEGTLYMSQVYEVEQVNASNDSSPVNFTNLTAEQKEVFLGALNDSKNRYEHLEDGGGAGGMFDSIDQIRYEDELYQVAEGAFGDWPSYKMSVDEYEPPANNSSNSDAFAAHRSNSRPPVL